MKGPWVAFPPRMVTGDPYRFYGYVGRENVGVERHCCGRKHRKYKGQKLNAATRARQCAEQTARKLNREAAAAPKEGSKAE
jgi:hypothetical protein